VRQFISAGIARAAEAIDAHCPIRCSLRSNIRNLPVTDTGREKAVPDVASRYPDPSYLGEYLLLVKRISQFAEEDQAWLRVVKDDGRIHGVTNPMETTSSSAARMAPNLGQVVSTLLAWALHGVVTKLERMMNSIDGS
jgi:hypothetical protein